MVFCVIGSLKHGLEMKGRRNWTKAENTHHVVESCRGMKKTSLKK